MSPFKLPLRVGLESGHHAQFIYDADGLSVFQTFGVFQNTSVEDARAEPMCAEAMARADYAVAAVNERAELLKALATVTAIAVLAAPQDKALVDAVTHAQNLLAKAGV